MWSVRPHWNPRTPEPADTALLMGTAHPTVLIFPLRWGSRFFLQGSHSRTKVPGLLLFQRSPDSDSLGLGHPVDGSVTSSMTCSVCAQIYTSVCQAPRFLIVTIWVTWELHQQRGECRGGMSTWALNPECLRLNPGSSVSIPMTSGKPFKLSGT